ALPPTASARLSLVPRPPPGPPRFPYTTLFRSREALDDNRRAIEETAALAAAGASGSRAVLVLVAGGLPEGSTDLIGARQRVRDRSEEHTSELQSRFDLVCRLLLEKKKNRLHQV